MQKLVFWLESLDLRRARLEAEAKLAPKAAFTKKMKLKLETKWAYKN
jgi:hypothetical protein